MSEMITLEPLSITDLPVDVYVARSEEHAALYVGVTGSLATRMRAHQATDTWWPLARSLTVERFLTRREATGREDDLIAELRPIFNRTDQHRGRLGWWLLRDEDVLVLVLSGWTVRQISLGIGMALDAVENSLARLKRDGRLVIEPVMGARPTAHESVSTLRERVVATLGRVPKYDTAA